MAEGKSAVIVYCFIIGFTVQMQSFCYIFIIGHYSFPSSSGILSMERISILRLIFSIHPIHPLHSNISKHNLLPISISFDMQFLWLLGKGLLKLLNAVTRPLNKIFCR